MNQILRDIFESIKRYILSTIRMGLNFNVTLHIITPAVHVSDVFYSFFSLSCFILFIGSIYMQLFGLVLRFLLRD